MLVRQNYFKSIYQFLPLFILILFTACGNPMKILKKHLKKNGYILYQTPMKYAGTGTMLGGRPSQLSIVSGPTTCFPDSINEVNTNLRFTDEADLPSRTQSFSVSGGAKANLLDVLGQGQGTIKAGVRLETVQSIDIAFEGVKVEYIDSVILKSFYDHHMSELCKDFLNQVPFIIQALRVDKMSFKFESKSGGYLELSAEAVKELFDFSADVKWSLSDKFTLNIDSPKYIGYQLGKLQKVDDGLALFRATRTYADNFIFESLNVFNPRTPSRAIPQLGAHYTLPTEFNWDFERL